jgi:hypothetical protein
MAAALPISPSASTAMPRNAGSRSDSVPASAGTAASPICISASIAAWRVGSVSFRDLSSVGVSSIAALIICGIMIFGVELRANSHL